LQTYAPLTARSIQFKDDLGLISYMQNLMEQPGILYAMVLSPKGDVLAHNQIKEVGKTYDDLINQKDVKAEGLRVYSFTPEGQAQYKAYGFSIPLSVQGVKVGVLRLALSAREIDISMEKYLEKMLVFGLLVLLAGILVSYLFSSILLSPVHRVKEIIEDLGKGIILSPRFGEAGGKMKGQRSDELGELIKTVECTAQQISEQHKHFEEQITNWRKKFEIYLTKLGQEMKDSVILTDSENRIIYINDLGKKIISSAGDDLIGKHILETARNIEFIDLFKKATKNPQELISEEIKSINRQVRIITVIDDEQNLLGTITLA